MSEVMKELLDLLDLEPLEVNFFRGRSKDYFGHNMFGGQVLGQALMAAGRTLDDREPFCHSLHAYFLRPGKPTAPVVYTVERVRDGKTFTTRTVKATQFGEIIFTMMASFSPPEPGLEHQEPMPAVGQPDDYPDEWSLRKQLAQFAPTSRRAYLEAERPIEIRLIDPVNPMNLQPKPPIRGQWMRSQMRLPDDPFLHQCILAFASDFGLMGTAMLPHAVFFTQPNMQCASIDHAMWFHRPFRMDEWLYYHMDSPSSSAAKGLNRGQIFTQDGRLIASTAQEGLIRQHPVKS